MARNARLASARLGGFDKGFGRCPDAAPDSDLFLAARRTRGCLGRLVLLMVFMVLALMSGMLMLGGSLLRMFLPY